MKKNWYFNYIYSTLFCLFLTIGTQYSQAAQLKPSDPASVQWDNRPDVQKAAKQLNEAFQELEIFVQKIYNAYAPCTIGEGKLMRDRMKDLFSLVESAGWVEGINIHYQGSIGWKKSFQKKMTKTKEAITFYYVNQQLKTILGWNTNVISTLKITFEALCNKKWHPDFERVTNFNKDEANALLIRIDTAIHAAMATIPGGTSALKP
jgi:hypothetical protein